MERSGATSPWPRDHLTSLRGGVACYCNSRNLIILYTILHPHFFLRSVEESAMTSLYWGVQLNMQGGFVSRHSFSRSASRLQTGGRKGGFVTTLAVVNGVARRGCRRWGCRQRDAEDPPQLARGDRWCVTEGSRPLDRPGVGAGGGRFTGRRRAGGASQTATCPPRTRERISRPLMALGARGRPLHHPNRWHLI